MTRTERQIEAHRKGDAVIEVRDGAGRPRAGLFVWAEQEAHEFLFGCADPNPGTLPEAEGTRYRARWEEVFNGSAPGEESLRLDAMRPVHLGALRQELDRRAAPGRALEVHVSGQTVGLSDRDERHGARRVADLYALCFAHPAVRGIVWHGLRDGDGEGGGLLRRDLSPKPAHRTLQKLIGVIWHTRAAGATDAEGRFAFRGFQGTYRVAVMAAERAATVASLSLSRQRSAPAIFTLTSPSPLG